MAGQPSGNIAPEKAIEDSIRQGFDGVHLKDDCAKEVLEEFGFQAGELGAGKHHPGKEWRWPIRPDNRSWAQHLHSGRYGPQGEFIVNSHSEVVNGFVNQVWEAYQKLNLFGLRTLRTQFMGGFRLHRKGAGTESGHSERILLDTGKSALVCP